MNVRPERVHPALAERVYQENGGKGRGSAFSDYIVLHFRVTGDLAPGCDAKDFLAWWDQRVKEVSS